MTCLRSLCLLLLATPLLAAETADYAPPPEAGYLNVRELGAKGDGVTDDTAVLKAVIESGKTQPHARYGEARRIYFPNGVYLISQPLLIGDKKKMLIGQSRDGAVIRLKDRCAAFEGKDPLAVLSYVSSFKGWHFAQNFSQRIHNLTIDVGAGNPAAVALNYHTNNAGDVYNVRLRSSDPQKVGAVGLLLGGQTGPGLVHQVEIEGFDTGILYMGSLHSMTLSRITLREQRTVGIRTGNVLAIEGLVSQNRVPALRIEGGHLALTGAKLTGGDPNASAVEHDKGVLFIRNLETAGYGAAIKSETQRVAGPSVAQFVRPKVWTLHDKTDLSINLPIEYPPLDAVAKPAEVPWFVVKPDAEGDVTKPMQAAIDAGHEYIMLSGETLGKLRDTIHVRGKVKLIQGAPSAFRSDGFDDDWTVVTYKPLELKKPPQNRPVWRIEDGASPVVMLKLIGDSYGDAGWGVDHASQRTLILHAAGGSYRNTVTGGKVFFLDAGPHPGTLIKGPQQAWAWNCNIESYAYDPNIVNDGGTLWIMGLKSEKDRTLVSTLNGGATEVIGGLFFKNRERIGPAPALISRDSRVSYSYAVTRLPYQTQIVETRGGRSLQVLQNEVGWMMPLFVGDNGR